MSKLIRINRLLAVGDSQRTRKRSHQQYMKKLLIFCALAACSAMFASRVDATIVILTDDTETLDAPTVMDVNFLAEYDLIGDFVTSLLSKDSLYRNESTDTLHTLPNGNIALSTFSGTESSELIFEDGGQIAYNPLTEVAALFFYEYLFDKKQIIDLVYVPDNNNIVQSSTPRAIPTSPTFKDSSPAEYDPITNTAKSFFDGYLFAEHRVLDAVSARINDIILLTTPSAVLGGLSFRHSSLSKYHPTTNIATLLFDEYLSAKSELLEAVYITDNKNNIIVSTAPNGMLGSLAFKDSAFPEHSPATKTAALFFNKDLFERNELPDAVYVPDNNNIILSNAHGPILGSLTFENNNLIAYNPITNVAALRFQKSIFAKNVNTLDMRTAVFVAPEPATIAMLSLGTLFLLRKRKGKAYRNK